MNTKKVLSAAVMAAVLSSAAIGVQSVRAEEAEKCYGVAKAGQNGCGNGAHGCAGHAATDADPSEWLSVPAGLCAKLAGGSLAAPAATDAAPAADVAAPEAQ